MLLGYIRRNFSRKEMRGSVSILVEFSDTIPKYINKLTEYIEQLYFIGEQKM